MRSRIWQTLARNTLMSNHVILIASIMASYEIDWANLIIEQNSRGDLEEVYSIPFLCLIYKLYSELGVESLHYLDSLIEVHYTIDTSLIKAEDNLWHFSEHLTNQLRCPRCSRPSHLLRFQPPPLLLLLTRRGPHRLRKIWKKGLLLLLLSHRLFLHRQHPPI